MSEVTSGTIFLDTWAKRLPLEVDRVAPVPGGDEPRVWFRVNPDHGPDPVDWPLDQVTDGSRFVLPPS